MEENVEANIKKRTMTSALEQFFTEQNVQRNWLKSNGDKQKKCYTYNKARNLKVRAKIHSKHWSNGQKEIPKLLNSWRRRTSFSLPPREINTRHEHLSLNTLTSWCLILFLNLTFASEIEHILFKRMFFNVKNIFVSKVFENLNFCILTFAMVCFQKKE